MQLSSITYIPNVLFQKWLYPLMRELGDALSKTLLNGDAGHSCLPLGMQIKKKFPWVQEILFDISTFVQ